MAKTINYISLSNLSLYDSLIKDYIATEDAKSLKTVSLDGTTLKFYRISEPVGSTDPDYIIELPETDLSGVEGKITAIQEIVDTLNGAENVVGSVKYQIGEAKKALQSSIDQISDEISDLQTSKADKSNTLGGYGITDAYTKAETNIAIATAVANADHLKRTIVSSLPDVADADPNTIYMIPKSLDANDKSDENGYNEYILVETDGVTKFEKIGDSTVDLTDYATKSYVDSSTDSALNSAKSYADSLSSNYATAEQGKKADTAVQAIETGTIDGTISVDGTNVAVAGLGSAAYQDTTDFDAAGTAEAKMNELADTKVADNTTAIASLESRIDAIEGASFVPATEQEIKDLFS